MKLLVVFLLLPIVLFAQQGKWYKSIDGALLHPNEVYQLQLKRKGLKSFPEELSQFPNLVKLDLSKNKIHTFPDTLTYLSKLQFLDLSRNDIESIPEHISQLESLAHLDLWDNYIDRLPEQMSELKNLKYLDIRGVAMSYDKYNSYLKMMEGLEFFMSEPCDCQE